MTAILGVNTAGRAEFPPAALTSVGARIARAVYYPDFDLRPWIQDAHLLGLKVLMVLARESIGDDPNGWDAAIRRYGIRYTGLVDYTQVGNESDHESPSSWTMKSADLNTLLATARRVLGDDAYIVGPGLVSGNVTWPQHMNIDLLSGLAFHPYAKDVGTPELEHLIAGYAAYGLPCWVTEYDSRTIGMAAALRDDPRIEVALAFCYSSQMVAGFGLIENPPALADYLLATGGPLPITGEAPAPPVTPPHDDYWVGEGLRAAMNQRGDFALGPENYLAAGVSVAPGDKALYWWTPASKSVRVVPWEKP